MKLMTYKDYKRVVAIVMTLATVAFSSGRAQAMLAPATVEHHNASSVRSADFSTVQKFLERKEVRSHLSGYGLSENEIQSRLDSLSDVQLHQISSRINQQRPAGDSAVGVLVIVVLVLLIIYLVKRV